MDVQVIARLLKHCGHCSYHGVLKNASVLQKSQTGSKYSVSFLIVRDYNIMKYNKHIPYFKMTEGL